jgi:hypothetical protein
MGIPTILPLILENRTTELERLAIQSNQREQELRTRLEEVIRAVIRNQASAGTNRDRNISEFRAVLNLKILTDDRAGYKDWHTKFVNAMSQARPGMRELLQELELHRDEAWTEQDFDLFMQDDRYRGMHEGWSADLWWVLVEKTTGDALMRVQGVSMGNGMEADRRLHRFYGEHTDLGLVELRQRVLRPTQSRREEDTARCIE